MAFNIETIPAKQEIPWNVNDFRQLPAIEWAVTRGGQQSSMKYFDAGRDTRWDCSKLGNLSWDDIWGDDVDDGFEMSVKEKNELWFISWLDLDTSRQFRTFTSLGFEVDVTGGTKGSIYLHKVGREYKKPGTNETWSYSDSDLDGEFYNKRGTFYHETSFNSSEISKQEQGYILNRIYFNYGTTGSGQSVTGGGPYTQTTIFNLKLGWGDRNQATDHRICLPKIRPFDQAAQLQFG